MTAIDRSASAILAEYGPEWWGADEVRHILSNVAEDAETQGSSVAHDMWQMGAWLKHSKCPNNPKRADDANYENGCRVCERYLFAAADAVLAALALEGMTKERDRFAAMAIGINTRLDQPVRPYGDPSMQMSTERSCIRGLYGDSVIDDIEAILAGDAA